jgi:alanine dehydrogenase
MVLMAFYHMAVADRGLVDTLAERSLTASVRSDQQEDGQLPVWRRSARSQADDGAPIAAHLLRSSSGGRGILLGGTPGSRRRE